MKVDEIEITAVVDMPAGWGRLMILFLFFKELKKNRRRRVVVKKGFLFFLWGPLALCCRCYGSFGNCAKPWTRTQEHNRE